MDSNKRLALKAELLDQAEPLLVDVAQFFDGNDDAGSIGCNLFPHPGIAQFRDTLIGLRRRPDVERVYAWISEVDPGEDSWPFSDTVLVVGSISVKALHSELDNLQPDEVGMADKDELGDALPATSRALVAWWD